MTPRTETLPRPRPVFARPIPPALSHEDLLRQVIDRFDVIAGRQIEEPPRQVLPQQDTTNQDAINGILPVLQNISEQLEYIQAKVRNIQGNTTVMAIALFPLAVLVIVGLGFFLMYLGEWTQWTP